MKNTKVIIAIIVLLLLGAGSYFYMQNKTPSGMMEESNSKKMAAGQESTKMSLKDLMNLGTSQSCTFSYAGEHGSTEGTSYISGKKVRTDFSGADKVGKAYTGGMIMDESYIYSWTSDMEQGIKMPVTETMKQAAEEAKENPDEVRKQYINPEDKMDYKCSSWSEETSKFTPPSNITFMDVSQQTEIYDQMMKQQDSSMSESDKQSACSSCASLTGDAATACKQALNCQ